MTPEEELKSDSAIVLLQRIARDITTVKTLVSQGMIGFRDAESEVPEKLRRFMNYCHDLHAMKFMYEEHGHQAPEWVMRELERIDDRYRQIIAEMKAEGGPINKVIREMAKDPANRWDHAKLLPKPMETNDETRQRTNDDGSHEGGASADGSQS